MGPSGLGLYVEGNQGAVSVTGSRFMKVQGYDVYAKEATAKITGNWFEGRGVWSGQEPMGIRLQDCLDGVEVTGNRFRDKMQHALYAQSSDVLFSGNKVDGLVSDYEDINGPAVKLVSCTGEVTDNLFSGNQFGGILFEKTSGRIMGNLIEGSVPSDPGLKGGDGVVLVACDGEPVVVQNNTIAGNTRNGVLVSGSDAEVVNNVVVDTLPSPLAGSEAAAGINVVAKSSVKTQGNRVLRSTGGGIRYDEAFGSISGNEVTGVEEHPAAGCGVGILVLGSFLSAVQQNRVGGVLGVGIRVFEGKVNFVRGNLVEGAAQTSRSLGVGIALSNVNGALVGNAVLGAEDAGMVLEALGGAVTDNTVEQCGEASGLGGVVVMNSTNPPVQLERNTVNGCFGHGLAALNLYGQFKNNVVYGTQAGANGAGVGIWVQGEGEFSLSRNLVEESIGAGLLLVDAPTVTIGSTLVRGVSGGTVDAEGSSQEIDAGVLLLSGSVVTLVNSRIEEAAGDGLFIGSSSEATLANSEFVGNGGAGIEVAGTLTEEGTRFSGNTLGERILDSVKALVADLMGLPEVCGEENG